MDENGFEISRRKVLAGVGGIGAASAGAGMGTSAFFSDTESFENNELVAGELDLSVGFQTNYSDWSSDEDTETASTFFEETFQGSNVTGNTGGGVLANAKCSDLPTGGQAPRTVIEIEDVKPGDFGFVAFKLGLCGTNANPGYLWTNSRLTSTSGSGPNDENDKPEPEVEDDDEADPFGIEGIDGELGANIRVRPFYANSTNNLSAFENLFGIAGSGKQFAEKFFEYFKLDPELLEQQNEPTPPTLLDFTDALAQGRGLPLIGDPQGGSFGLETSDDGNFELVKTLDGGNDIFSLSPEGRGALETGTANTILFGLAWGMPVDHANETQTDSVAFDLGFYTEQERHNSGLGASVGGVELDKSQSFSSGSGHTAAGSLGSYAVRVSEATFSGISGPVSFSTGTVSSAPQVVLGIHAPSVISNPGPGLGAAPPINSLVGFATVPQGGTLGTSQVAISNTGLTGTVDGAGTLQEELQNGRNSDGSVDITATLWHAFDQELDPNTQRPIRGISPAGPVRDVDGNVVQDQNVPVKFL